MKIHWRSILLRQKKSPSKNYPAATTGASEFRVTGVTVTAGLRLAAALAGARRCAGGPLHHGLPVGPGQPDSAR